MLYHLLILTAALGQATQPASQPAASAPRVSEAPRMTVAKPAPTPMPVRIADMNTTRPAGAVATTVPAQPPAPVRTHALAPATRPAGSIATAVAAQPPAPVRPQPLAPATQPTADAIAAAQRVMGLPATQPARAAAPASQPEQAMAATTQPSGVLGELSGEPVDIQVTQDGNIIMQGNPKDLEILQEFVRQLERQPVPVEFQIFKLNGAQAQNLGPQIQSFWLQAKQPAGRSQMLPEDKITIIPEPRSNSLMVAASRTNMPEVEKLIKMLDQSIEMTFTPVTLKHVKAAEAQQTLDKLLKAQAQKQGGQQIDIQADPRTNTLLISAPKADMDQINKLIALLDVEPTAEAGGVVKLAVFQLEKGAADKLSKVLEDMFASGAESTGGKAAKEVISRLQIMLKSKRGDRELPPLNLEKPIRILADMGTNSLIVATIESNLEPIGEIIHLLDGVPLADEMMVKIYPLEHADADSLMTSLKEIFAQGLKLPVQPGREEIKSRTPPNLPGAALAHEIAFTVDKRTNALVVAGRPEQLVLIEQVVNAVDVQEDATKFSPRVIQLQHADVTKVSEAMQKLADQRQQVAEKFAPNTAIREKTLILPDTRTNSLIIVTRQDQYDEFVALARQLDGVAPEYLGKIHIINLENLTAAEIADKVKELWTGRAKSMPGGDKTYDQPVVVTDARSNSLVIASNQEDYELIAKIIRELEQQKLSPMADIRPVVLKHSDGVKTGEIIRKLFDERRKNSLAKGEEERPTDKIAVVEDPATRTLFVASSKSNYEEVVRVVSLIDVPPVMDGILRTFTLKNAPDVDKVREMLQQLFDKGVYRGAINTKDVPESLTKATVISDPRSGIVIVSASPENMAIAERFISEIDRAEIPASLSGARFFQLRNADAIRVSEMLDNMLKGLQDAQKSDKDLLSWKIIPDTRSNSIIVTGSKYAVRRAEELIPRLDEASSAEALTAEVRVYPLHQGSALRLEPVITQLFEKGKADTSGKRTPINVIADEGSNSLIVTGSREDHAALTDLLTKLDTKSGLSQQLEIVRLKEAKAKDLADMLTKLVEQQKGSVAKTPGFAVTPEERTNSLLVFAPADMMENVRSIVEKLDNTRPKVEMALNVFPLHNQKAEDLSKRLDEFFKAAGAGDSKSARQMIIKFSHINPDTGEAMLRSLVHQDVTITPDETTNSLIVMAPEQSIDMMQMLVEMLDSVKPVTVEVQVFPLINADATEMQKLLEELFRPKSTSGKSTQRTLVIAGAEGGTLGASSTAEGTVADIVFSVDQRTNSLIAAGSPAYLRIAEKLVMQLDYRDAEERTVRVVHLRYGKAKEVATTMSSYFKEESSAIEKASKEEAAPRQLQREVTIQDGGETSNALLLSYSPRMEPQILNIISELDQPPPQVMIQVLMAEVTLDDRLELGMEFALQDLNFSDGATVGNNGTLEGRGFDKIFGTDVGAAGSGGLAGMSFTVTGEDFNFMLRALQSEGRVEVLSRPSIMVRDNQEATINVGERVPTVTDITVSGAGVVTPSVSYEDVGIILTVTPIINPDGFVNLEIKPEISAIGTSSVTVASGVSLPTFTQRKAETTVNVKDSETIIIGGLITSTENNSESKVPIAGDIPFIGNAFRASIKTIHKTELLIVLTPHVIRTPEDARSLSVGMRDGTGLNDNIRKSPLMSGLQVTPEQDQMGPIEPLRPAGTNAPAAAPEKHEEQGPELEEFGPPTTSIEVGPTRDSIAVRSE